MFRIIKFKVLSMIFLCLIYLAIIGTSQPVYSMGDSTKTSMKEHQGMKKMMHDMHNDMMGMKMTGDPDADFAQMMIRHHKGAVKMSDNVIDNGKDEEIKSMAEKVKDSQKKDIEDLKTFTKKEHAANEGDNEMTGENTSGTEGDHHQMSGSMESEMMKPMEDMVGEVDKMKMTGDVDKDYASMMIIHHNAAIDMAEEYLDKGKDEKLKRMAERMIQDNKNDIQKFEDWQSRHE